MSDPELFAEYILERLCDPECPAPPMPTPYTDLPKFIELAWDVVTKLHPPLEIQERISAAVKLATDMLRTVSQ